MSGICAVPKARAKSVLSAIMKNMGFLNIPFAEHVAFDNSPDVFLDSVGKFFGIELKN